MGHASVGQLVAEKAPAGAASLSTQQVKSFDRYADELVKWNSKVNLTAITKPREIAIKHFVDSLALLPYLSVTDRLLDIGSGAGLPIIPLKIMLPDVAMVAVDAVAKKIHFQRHVIRLLSLTHIEALHSRVEELHRSHGQQFTLITSRAFTRLDRFVELAAPLLAEGGVLIAMKGDHGDREITESDEALRASGFVVSSVVHYELPDAMGSRNLTFMKRCEGP